MPLPGEESTAMAVGLKCVLSVIAHPVEYAKVLIQIGYEPIPPRATRTFFGKPALALPNVFKYVGHIYNVDGFAGCYRGLAPKLCAVMAGGIVARKCDDHVQVLCGVDRNKPYDTEEDLPDLEREHRFAKEVARSVLLQSISVIVSHPFHVVYIRVMAQHVGGETVYKGIFSSLYEIWRQEGLLGFFAGLIPRLLGEILTVAITSSVAYCINYYMVHDRDLFSYTTAAVNFWTSTFTYPFHVVSSCMIVSDSGIAAGKPPRMPLYRSWIDCWSHLSKNNQLNRGSNLLRRFYTGPQVVIKDQAIPLL